MSQDAETPQAEEHDLFDRWLAHRAQTADDALARPFTFGAPAHEAEADATAPAPDGSAAGRDDAAPGDQPAPGAAAAQEWEPVLMRSARVREEGRAAPEASRRGGWLGRRRSKAEEPEATEEPVDVEDVEQADGAVPATDDEPTPAEAVDAHTIAAHVLQAMTTEAPRAPELDVEPEAPTSSEEAHPEVAVEPADEVEAEAVIEAVIEESPRDRKNRLARERRARLKAEKLAAEQAAEPAEAPAEPEPEPEAVSAEPEPEPEPESDPEPTRPAANPEQPSGVEVGRDIVALLATEPAAAPPRIKPTPVAPQPAAPESVVPTPEPTTARPTQTAQVQAEPAQTAQVQAEPAQAGQVQVVPTPDLDEQPAEERPAEDRPAVDLPPEVDFQPRTGLRRVTGIAFLAGIAVTALAGVIANADRTQLNIGLAIILGFLTIVIWGVRASAPVARLSLHGGMLEVHSSAGRHVFDLNSAYTPVEMIGTPGHRGWKMLFHRRGMSAFTVTSAMVDATEFVEAVRYYRPQL